MKLSIKSKLLSGFTIILVLLISMLFFMINKFSESNHRMRNMVEVSSKRINLSNELIITVLEAARHEKNLILEKDLIQKQYFRDRLYRSLESIDRKTNELHELLDDNSNKILNEFEITWISYKVDLNKIIALAMKNKEEEAFDISIARGLEVRDASISQLERLVDRNEKSMLVDNQQNDENYKDALSLIIALIIASIVLAVLISSWIIQSITKRISVIAKEAEKIASREFSNDILVDDTDDELKTIFNSLVNVNESFREVTEKANNIASGDYDIDLVPRSANDILGNALNKMTGSIREITEANAKYNWLTTGQNQLNKKLIGVQSLEELASNTISFLCTYLKANIGAVYLFNEKENALLLSGKFAYLSATDTQQRFSLNEGLIGQAAREKKQISLTDITEDQIRITSSILNAKPKHVLITPILFENETVGVIEMGRLTEFNENEKEFIDVSIDIIATSVNSATDRNKILELLVETQVQSDDKEKRAAELAIANKELAFQNNEKENRAAELSIANKELAFQNDEKENRAAELSIANKELAFQNDEKEKRAAELSIANKELAFQNDEKEKRAAELAIANKELAFQNDEKENRAAELSIANKELAFQNDEKENRAAELSIANKELAFQNDEKEKRAAELIIANKELAFQNDEKENRAAELVIANKKLAFLNDEKEDRAAELIIANEELAFQNIEKEKRAEELSTANQELANQAEELQTQQEVLRQMNEELEGQAQNLIQQQEELQMSNEELEEQTQSLEIKNAEVIAAKFDIEQKTKQLEISSKYKSEFLANMSHELRTPLNSLLILSKDLAENRKQNLDDIQIESAEIIYKSGHDLLVLINEVLDLSKIEAGKMAINVERVSLKEFANDLIRNFKHHAEQKELALTCFLDNNLPEFIRTDSQRLNQILKNLLSNAIKFTEKGTVSIRINRNTETTFIISVTDTGLGIMEDKQMAIFEAFQQADGGTSRKYGGTGLGLSISRELAKLLSAEIKVSSKINEGSTFSVILPFEIMEEPEVSDIKNKPVLSIPHSENDPVLLNYPTIKDDRENIIKDDKVLLIIEDDLIFATILLKQANKKGFRCLSAASGEDGLIMASTYKPQAIILDMGLPGISGHDVLLELKANPAVRHIPVHIMSAADRSLEHIKDGAVEYLRKPLNKKELDEALTKIDFFVSRKIKNLLIIEDNENSRKAIKTLIGNSDVKCLEVGTGNEAIALYQKEHIDCIILDLNLPDISGFELIHKLAELKSQNIPPIIIYTGKELTKEENAELQKYSESIIIKGVKSEERLLDETALFLHRTMGNLPKHKQLIDSTLYDKEAVFHTKKILLVDDDTRNVFALSKILKERGLEIIKAENGEQALEMLDLHSDIDLVLMDIMMPIMDGYEAMSHIRSQAKYQNLPVIALTAKAMKDDRLRCINAGANDYITKPIDADRLLSLMRVWLSR